MAKLFFNKSTLAPTAISTNFLPLDGGGFRAVAVGLMDQSMGANVRPPAWMLNVLDRYAEFFPDRMPVWGINQSRDLELKQLTYTLARISLDELCTNPIKYPDAFKHDPHDDLNSWAEKMIVAPHKHALIALAHAIKLPIEIHTLDSTHEVSLRTVYMRDYAGDLGVHALSLRLYSGKFSPRVDQVGVWRGIEKLEYLPLNICPLTFSISLQTIDAMLESSELAIWDLYKQNLQDMQSRSFTEAEWHTIYKKNWHDITQINILGCEHGLQAYFEKLAEKYGDFAFEARPWLAGVARAITLNAFNYQVNQACIGRKET